MIIPIALGLAIIQKSLTALPNGKEHRLITGEPLNTRHIGASYSALCRDVICSSEVQNVLRT